MINQDDARNIAKKLGIEPKPGSNHDNVAVWYKGKYVARYGIRRGSRQQAHSYIPQQLYISARQAKDLSRCPMSAADYFRTLIDKGLLEEM